MKRSLLFTLSILLTNLGMSSAVHAGANVWTSIGPDGGRVQAIAVDPQIPDTVYAVAGGSIFKTTDGAANWRRVYSPATSDGAANYPVTLVAINPADSNIVYAGTSTAGVFKSTDGGASWTMANAGLPKPTSDPNDFLTTGTASVHVGILAIDPRNPETIYAGVSVNYDGPIPSPPIPTLFKSTDGGASWSAASSGLFVNSANPQDFAGYVFVSSLVIDPQNPNTLYAAGWAGNGGLFKSTDGAANWTRAGVARAGGVALAIDPRNSNTLYVWGTFNPSDGILKSTDGGASWRAANSGLPPGYDEILSLTIDPQNPDTLYASVGACRNPCTYSGVFKSTDGGTSWTGSGLPYSTPPTVLTIDPISSKTVYASTYNGIAKSLDGGASWNAANSGLIASQLDSLAIDPQYTGGFFATSRGKVLRMTDGGAHWSGIYTPLPSDDGRATYPASTVAADPGAPGTIYVGIDGNGDGAGGILKSTDGGESWKRTPLPSPGGVRALSMDPQNPSTLYASVAKHAVYKSTDGGANWNEVAGVKELKRDPTGAPTQCFGSVVADPGNPSNLYVGICGFGGGLLKSMDGGQTWTLLVIPDLNYPFNGVLAVDPENSSTLYVSDFPRVLKTTDGGQNWRAFSSGLPATFVRFIAVHPQNSNIVYAVSSGRGIFWSTNGGANWSPLNAGLADLNVQNLLIDPRSSDTLYAGTYDGGVFTMTFAPKP
jgi:photosystem II stability/assembly factor-like uncharacterized protein